MRRSPSGGAPGPPRGTRYDWPIVSRRRLLLGVVIALLVLVGAAVAGVGALPAVVRWAVSRQLASTTGRPVTLDGVELSLRAGHLVLRGLRVMDRDGAPLATLDRLDLRFEPRALLRGRGHVTDATIEAPTVRIVRTGPSTFNVSDVLGRRAGKAGKPPALTVDRLTLAGGVVVIEDRTLTPARTWRVEPLEAEIRGASTLSGAPPGTATVRAMAAGAPVALTVEELRLAPLSFRATLSARDVDASLAALYLPPRSPLTPTRGALAVSAKVEHDAAAGTRAALDVGLTGVELHRPGQDRPYLSAPAVRIAVDGVGLRGGVVEVGRVAVDGGTATLEDARLGGARRWQVDGIALEARNLSSARDAAPGIATARAVTSGARVEVWAAEVRLAPLELNATAIVRNVDLSALRLALPPGLPARPERGVVNATVRVQHDARSGTRGALDAGLASIEVQRPAHVVTAPAMRVIVDGIALGGGTVDVGRVSVTGERLTIEERAAGRVRRWPVQNLVVEAKDLSSRRSAVQGVASLRATVAGAAASVFVTGARLDPLELRATAILRNFDAALLEHYLPSEMPLTLAAGTVNATVEIDQAAAATTITGDAMLSGFRAQGRGAFATLAVAAPSARVTLAEGRRQGPALSVGRVALGGSGTLTDSRGAGARFDFTSLDLTTENLTWPVSAPARVALSMRFQDRGELDGTGTARLTAPLPTIAWTADLALSFRGVDLTPLAVYVPAATGFGGRVRAKLTATLAYAGELTAHLRGDVGGARFALVEGGRPVLSLRSINATGLDLQWPERMAIATVRLREPHGLLTRDRHGAFPLAARFAAPRRAPSASTDAAPPGAGPRRPLPSIALGEVLVENGSATFVDEQASPPVRVDVPRLNLTLRNVTWPASSPLQLAMDGTFPSGGTMKVEGTATAEPAAVDLTITCRDADLAVLQPYMGVRARVGGRAYANVTVSGPLSPSPQLTIKGEAGLRAFEIADGQQPVLAAEQFRITGIDADWPRRVALDRIRMRRSWARIERDAQGQFLLRTLLERRGPPARPSPSTAAPAPVPAPAPTPALEFSFREAVFEDQSATIIDRVPTPDVRLDVAGARLVVRDFVWPSRSPARVELTSPMPTGGRVEVGGTVQLEPMRLVARAVLDAVAIDPVQPYLPIEGRVAGKVTGDVTMKMGLDPTTLQVTGQARLQAFNLRDGDRAVVTVGRVETSGIDVDWPRRIAVGRVLFRRPSLLIERDAQGDIRLRRLVTPRWDAVPAARAPGGTPAPAPKPPAPRPPPPAIDIGTLTFEKARARFVDQTTTPPYAEELEEVDASFTPFTTQPGRRTRFAVTGVVGGGSFKAEGEEAEGERRLVDLKFHLRDFVVPRANPYVDRYTGWRALRGSLDVTGTYKLDGTQLETNHDVVVRGLDVAPVNDRDEVERRIGLPFGLLVSLLKDARGEIRLSLPVSGDLGTRTFDYQDAMWSAVRNLSIRLLALPFSKIGSMFFSQDSKVQAVALAPIVFEAGTDRLGQGMDPHLQKVAEFLRGTPAVKAILEPVLIDADVQALKRAQLLARLGGAADLAPDANAAERMKSEYRARWPDRPVPDALDAVVAELVRAETLPPDATRTLAGGRIEAVRQTLARAGVDPARLPGSARRTPLVEAAGSPRVEFDLRS